jgi:hypothetical protein
VDNPASNTVASFMTHQGRSRYRRFALVFSHSISLLWRDEMTKAGTAA